MMSKQLLFPWRRTAVLAGRQDDTQQTSRTHLDGKTMRLTLSTAAALVCLVPARSALSANACEGNDWAKIHGEPSSSSKYRDGISRTRGGTGEVAFWIRWLPRPKEPGLPPFVDVAWVKAKVNDIDRDRHSAVAQIRYKFDRREQWCYRIPAIDSGADGHPVTSVWYQSTAPVQDLQVRACLADRRKEHKTPDVIESSCDTWR
jgi:hypothetical protein